MKNRWWGLVIVLLFSLWAIKPLLMPGFFAMHDDAQVVRVYEMAQALKDEQFPVRWVKDLGYGYGYPIFNFYAPLPYYVGGMFNFLGMDALNSTKIMMVIAIILSGVFMYFLAREFWGELGGIISSLFYVYAPYHAVDIYVRGAVGEFWAYAFLPLLALGLYRKSIVIASVGIALVILSHNLTAIMIIPFLLIVLLFYCYVFLQKKESFAYIAYPLYAILLGLGLSIFYWLPALSELKYTNVLSQIGRGADFKDHFVCWQQLWNSPWGFGGSVPGCVDGLSFKIGKLHIILSLISLVGSLYFWKKDKTRTRTIFLSVFLLLVATFLTLEVSKPVWEIVTPAVFIQYPWRFLVLISLFTSLLAGGSIWVVSKINKKTQISVVILLFILLYGNLKLFAPQEIINKSIDSYINEENIKLVTSKISDEYMVKDFVKPNSKVDIAQRRISIGEIKVDKTQELIFLTNNSQEEKVLVKIAPFPGWKVFVDNKAKKFTNTNNGIEIKIPKDQHEVRLSFMQTQIENVSNLISLISLLALTGVILKLYYRA